MNELASGHGKSRVQIWATAHPIRFRIYELLREGPATASQLARRLGESSGTTSYHLRFLERTGAIQDDPTLGNRRERWWRRPDELGVVPTDADPEGRQIALKMFAMFFMRDEEARHALMTRELGPDWHEGMFVGNWLVELTPQEAAELGIRLMELVDEIRRKRPQEDADKALVSVSVLPWLG